MITLRTKITIIVSLVTGVLMVGAATFEAHHLIEQGQRLEQDNQAVQIANILPSVGDGIWDFDQVRTESVVRGLFDARATRRVQVIDPMGQVYVGLARDGEDATTGVDNQARLTPDESRVAQTPWNEIRSRTLKIVQLNPSRWQVVAPLWHHSARERQSFIGHLLVEYSTEESIARSENMMYRLLIGGFFIALLTVLLLSIALQYFVLKPVDVLLKATRAIAAGNFEEPIGLKTNDEMAILANSFDAMRLTLKDFTYNLQDLVRLRTAEVEEEKRKIQNILIHINEGILTFDSDFRIEREISDHLIQVLRQPRDAIVGHNVLELVFKHSQLSANSLDEIKASLLSIIGEDALGFEANGGHLPQEIQLGADGAQILDLDWMPIIDEATGLVSRMMLTLRDITEKRNMERQVQETRQAHAQLMRRVSEIVHAGVGRTHKVLADADQKISELLQRLQARAAVPHQESFPILHTLKGNMRSLGLSTLTDRIHLAEETIMEQRRGETLKTEVLADHLLGYQHEAQAYADTLHRVWGAHSHQAHNFVFAMIDPMLNEARGALEKAGIAMQRLDVKDGFVQWSPQGLSLLADVLLHALANTLDHGYLRPHSKGQPVPPFVFQIETQAAGDQVRVLIRDGGRGISPEALCALYQQSG
ncbi:MAG: HAMP domain-containing protein, partial [Pseudobdellovibrionaceae bacterium]|nr:HAMP domain-containing protein [Pseudobdellovibrionaceae bacterium]